MNIQDSRDVLFDHLTYIQSEEHGYYNSEMDWKLIQALEFAIDVLEEKLKKENKNEQTKNQELD